MSTTSTTYHTYLRKSVYSNFVLKTPAFVVSIVIATLFAAPLVAQSNEKSELITKLFLVNNPDGVSDESLNATLSRREEAYLKLARKIGLSDEARDALLAKSMPLLRQNLVGEFTAMEKSINALGQESQRSIESQFSLEELETINSFLSSELGKRFLKVSVEQSQRQKQVVDKYTTQIGTIINTSTKEFYQTASSLRAKEQQAAVK